MKFTVKIDTEIVCKGCVGTTRVVRDNVYNTDDLHCNCDTSDNSPTLFDTDDELKEDIEKAESLAEVKEPTAREDQKTTNAAAAKSDKRDSKDQAKMFEEEPEHVINPEDAKEMSESEVSTYLEGLQWKELLAAAKNNDVKKSPKMKAPELINLIIAKVFHE